MISGKSNTELTRKKNLSDVDKRGLSYTYPGSHEPALRNINLGVKPGETLAIVGYNGSGMRCHLNSLKIPLLIITLFSGKSTLAKVLLRIVDFDRGALFVNGVDIRRYHPAEYHRHLSAVFQGFSKFNSTVKENIGLGNVDKIGYRPAIETAVHLAEADNLVKSLPNGLKTQLETPGFESISYPGSMSYSSAQRHGLSGGEVSITLRLHALSNILTAIMSVATGGYCPRIYESQRT